MKKLFLLITAAFLLTVVIHQPVKAQTYPTDFTSTQFEAFNDTIGNFSSTHTNTFYIPVNTDMDSIRISGFYKGEIDLDSLIVKFIKRVSYTPLRGYTPQYEVDTSASSGTYGKTLTVNLDSAAKGYDSCLITIPLHAYFDSDYIMVTIKPATSGNDKADTGQRAVFTANRAFRYKPN
jgi:hypothetical protein